MGQLEKAFLLLCLTAVSMSTSEGRFEDWNLLVTIRMVIKCVRHNITHD